MNNITLKLTDQELAIVIEALGQMPLKLSVAVFQKIQQQVVEQRHDLPTPS
jgi:hypothetical protein